jgi:ribosome-associated translation inhibitor RaiA
MILTLEHFDLRCTNSVDTLIEERILGLEPRLHIDEARVRLERRHNISPPYRVAVHLVTPGPDLVAEGQDHTILAAIDKVMLDIESKLHHRADKRIRRARSNRQSPPAARAHAGMR